MDLPPELIEAMRKRDVKFLVKQLFPNIEAAQKITPMQCYIVRIIAFSEKKRISISAYTRYGKTQTVAIAVALYILINENKRVNFIGPSVDLASLIREYMADLILDCEPLLEMADLEATGKQRLKKEATKNRLTFSNGCEYRVVTAHGKGFSAMGKGGDLNCFPEHTNINTDRGLLDIKDIVESKIDCRILSLNHRNNSLEYKPILTYFKNNSQDFIKIITSKNNIICTPNHPIYTSRGYIPAKDLCVMDKIYMCKLSCKDKLQKRDLKEIPIQRIEKIHTDKRPVYNLEIKDNNNYFADSILVHNCMDEAALISREAYAKITRMLGDDPENSILIELMNPWDRDTKAFDHSISPRFERIEIDYRIGIEEGRTTQTFIDEQRDDISPLEFTVLYDSKFPDESEDSIHSLKKIEQAEKNRFYIEEDIKDILKIINHSKKYKESEVKIAKKELKRYKRIISCDPAEMGLDETVIKNVSSQDDRYFEVNDMYSEFKSDPMELVGKIMKRAREYIGFIVPGEIHIDRVGIGSGAFSRLKELKSEYNMKNLTIIGCHNGERPISTTKESKRKGRNKKKGEFSNKKIENNWRLKDLLFDNCISLYNITKYKDYNKLKTQMLAMKWKINSSELKEIITPVDSPDFNDALVYAIWRDQQKLTYSFI